MGAGHDHSLHQNNEVKVAIAAGLTGIFMVAEVVGGIISGSLALIADAGHMLTDFASLLLAWLAFRIGRRPADWKRTYGFDRFSILAAFVNGLSLFAIAAWIIYEAIKRLRDPHAIEGGLMLGIAVVGLIINIVAFYILTRGEKENLNIRAAALHVAGDLLGSVAAIVASIVILLTDWTPIDPILSVLVVLIILRSAWNVVRESGHILLEGAPEGFDRREVIAQLSALEGVQSIDHVHAWSVTQERPVVTMEVTPQANADANAVKHAIKDWLRREFNVDHATVEMRSPTS